MTPKLKRMSQLTMTTVLTDFESDVAASDQSMSRRKGDDASDLAWLGLEISKPGLTSVDVWGD